MRIVISGGGTAGHIYPALTVVEHLLAEGHEVLYIGTPDGLESRLVTEAGVSYESLRAKGYDRSKPFSMLTSSAVLAGSALKAAGMLRRWRPDVVVGFGGYVSIPVGLAAVLRRLPLVLHEQNSIPGMANRFLSRWAGTVCVTYEGSSAYLHGSDRAVLTGNPVRSAVLSAERSEGRRSLGVPDDATMLLIFGGSRGARHINRVAVASKEELLADQGTFVVHVAGHEEFTDVLERLDSEGDYQRDRYRVFDYIDGMGSAISAADLVVARAGATSIAEITALGRPSLLVPYPYATDDHQTLNAKAVVDAGGAVMIRDEDLESALFAETVTGILGDRDKRANMAAASASLGRSDAGSRVVSVIKSAADLENRS